MLTLAEMPRVPLYVRFSVGGVGGGEGGGSCGASRLIVSNLNQYNMLNLQSRNLHTVRHVSPNAPLMKRIHAEEQKVAMATAVRPRVCVCVCLAK